MILIGSTSLCENGATHEALHVDYLLNLHRPPPTAMRSRSSSQARTNSHDEYVARGNSAGSVVIIISGT